MKDAYSTSPKNASRLSKIGSNVSLPSPCREGVKLKFKMMCISSQDLETKTYKSRYNKRSEDHLGLASVLDIYPEISANGFNTHPALGEIDSDGNIGVLAGLRRRKAVSFVENGLFYIQVCSELTEAEKKAYASASDVYEEPTILDFGFTLNDYIKETEERGEEVSYDDLSVIFKTAKGKVSEAISFTHLPVQFIELFPSLKSLGYRYLREMIKLHKSNGPDFVKAIESEEVIAAAKHITNIMEDDISDTTNKLITVAITKLKKAINKAIEKTDVLPVDASPDSVWTRSLERQSVKVVCSKGKVQITFDEEKLGKKLSEALYNILK